MSRERAEALREAWNAVHRIRFTLPAGPDSFYNGVIHAQNVIENLPGWTGRYETETPDA